MHMLIKYHSINTHTFCEGGRIQEVLLVEFNDCREVGEGLVSDQV